MEVLEVSDIKDARLRYRNDVILVKLDAVDADKSLFAAYLAQQYLEEESAYLQRLADRGVDLLPDDLKEDRLSHWIQPQTVSSEESSLLQEIDDLGQEVTDAERAVADARATHGTTQDEAERSSLESRIKILESENSGSNRWWMKGRSS